MSNLQAGFKYVYGCRDTGFGSLVFLFLYVDTRVNGLLLFSSGVTGFSFAILLR